jgi:hypothetical protein
MVISKDHVLVTPSYIEKYFPLSREVNCIQYWNSHTRPTNLVLWLEMLLTVMLYPVHG